MREVALNVCRLLVLLVVAAAGGVLSQPLTCAAQSATKLPRVGYLLPSPLQSRNEPFWQGLATLGYVDGQNIVVERRYADGKAERYRELAAELVRLKVDVIVADGRPATQAAKEATATIPIVMLSANPVAAGFIACLNRPGGNITGLSTNSPTLIGKRLEILKEALPHLSRVAVLWNGLNPASAVFVREAEEAARTLGLQLHSTAVRAASEFEGAFAAMASKHVEAVLVVEDPTVIGQDVPRIVRLAASRRLPTMYGSDAYPDSGTLMIYGPSYAAMFRRTAFYVDKILKGAKPADLPAEEPSKFDLLVNLKTAKEIGVTIPPSVLLRADRVIQ